METLSRLLPLGLLVRDGVSVTRSRHGRPLAIARGLAGFLALEHLAVRGDTVAVALGDLVGFVLRVGLGGRPGQVVAADLDVVVGELAELVVVHAEQLGFFGGAQLQARDPVDDVSDQGADHEGVGAAGYNVRDLDVHEFPVVLDPAAGEGAGVDAVETRDVVGGENGVEEEADNTRDTMLGEDIHRVVNLDPVLDLGRKPEAGVAATRPEMVPEHQPTIDHFLARRQSRIVQVMAANMAVKFEFQQAMTARRLAPNEEPPLNPNHPNHSKMVPRVMRETLCGRKFNIIFSCLLPSTHEYASAVKPEPISTAVGAPSPPCEGAVYDRRPAEDEDHGGDETAAFGDGSHDNGGGDGAELHLKKKSFNSGINGLPGLGAPRVFCRPNFLRSPMKPLLEAMTAQIILRADFLRARPE
ncbi:ammonium transporter [Hortaea werneckii]|nr:ammonium transporter [Hortaea werneckii]